MSQESKPLTDCQYVTDTSFENEFNTLRSFIHTGNFEKAIQSFVLLHSNSLQSPTFQSFLIQLAENIDPSKDTDASRFFASLPCLLQSNIIDFATERLEEKESMRAFSILFDYIQAYPRHAYKYLIGAINLLILCTQAMSGDERQQCINVLVTELFPKLCKQRLLLVKKQKVPSIKSTDSKHFISLPYHLFEQFLLLGQRFYIKKLCWQESIQFTCAMLSACGYTGLDQLDSVSHQDRFEYLKDHRQTIRMEDDIIYMCEYMMASSEFVHLGYDYYQSVCGSGSEEKSCLIPICSFQTNTQNKRRLIEDEEGLGQEGSDEGGLGSDCVRGVDDALQILSKAGDCLRHIVELDQWASQKLPSLTGGWEKELCRVIDGYKLPFDMHNAVLLVRSDLALSSPSVPGNLAKALELSQSICDRIEIQRRQEKTDSSRTSTEMDIPFMFAFRVLYNIGIIYLLVGSLQQSTLEIAIILSVFPIPNGLDEKDFITDEKDCGTVANIFEGREFGLMRVTQEGLVVRCIKHLIVSLDNESEQKGGMASIDSALRWDEKAGNMIVLMQYGWPYWSNQTNLWHKIMNRISEKRVFKNREFLEYLYVSDVLQAIRHLHLMGTVTMDIIPPEFALRGSYKHLVTQPSVPSSPRQPSPKEQQPDDEELEVRHSLNLYHPSFANSILPSTSMSPSWYSASSQKNSFAKWMSPSFYYSRPATSVILPNKEGGDQPLEGCIPKDIVTRCLEYRIRRYSPKITPQRMRHVLQRFLKNMVLKANEET